MLTDRGGLEIWACQTGIGMRAVLLRRPPAVPVRQDVRGAGQPVLDPLGVRGHRLRVEPEQPALHVEEVSRLRTENQELRDQLARHLGVARATAATTGTPAVVTCPRTGCPLRRSRRGLAAGRN